MAAVLDGLATADGAGDLGEVEGLACDLGDESSVRAAVAHPDRLDHLVVTAAPGRGVTDRGFVDGKLWGSWAACDVAAARLPEDGCIVLTSGGLAVRPTKGEWSTSIAFAGVES